MATARRVLKDYGPKQAPEYLGLAGWQFEDARRRGLIAPPDCARGRYSAALIEDVAARLEEIRAVVGDSPPVGANKAADRIAARLDLSIGREEVEALVQRGLLAKVGEWNGWPTYDPRDLDAVADREQALLTELVASRDEREAAAAAELAAWRERSLMAAEAAARLGWRVEEFEAVAAERGLVAGRRAVTPWWTLTRWARTPNWPSGCDWTG